MNNPVGDPPSQFSWNDHSTAHRATVYACAATALPDEGWLLEAVEDHGEMLSSPDFYVEHSNHALNQNTGLLASGCLLDRDDWTSTALKRLEVLVEDSIDEQGVTNEQAIDYQYYNMARYKKAQEYLETCDLAPPATFERLDLMPDFLSHATMPNGDYVMLGDTEARPARHISGTEAEFAATQGATGPAPRKLTALYQVSGFLFGRTGWGDDRPFEDELFYSLRFGPVRHIHGHYDGGSVTLYGYGERLLIDSGKYAYESDDLREHFVSREAHNVVVTDREHQEVPTELLHHDSDDSRDVTIVRSQPYPGVEIQRTVVLSREAELLLIVDDVISDARTAFRQLWHFDDDAAPTIDDDAVRTRRPRGNVAIHQLGSQPDNRIIEGHIDPLQGWVSYSYGKADPAPTLEAVIEADAVKYVTLLVPFGDTEPDLTVSSVDLSHEGFSVKLDVDGDAVSFDVLYP